MSAVYITKYSSVSAASPVTTDAAIEHITMPNGKKMPVFKANLGEFNKNTSLANHDEKKIDQVTKLSLMTAQSIKNSISLEEDTFTNRLSCIAGSARGTTETLEKSLYSFYQENFIPTLTSPLTTAGGIASMVGSLWNNPPISLGTSMTCASFFEAILVADSLIKANRVDRSLVLGAEAPLTPFSISQMMALKLYSNSTDKYPCRPLAEDPENKNSLVLGEGAATFLLENEQSLKITGHKPLLQLKSIGIVQERDVSLTGVDPKGKSFYSAMKQALTLSDLPKNIFPDLIIAHAPGTHAGDTAEYNGIMQLANEYQVNSPLVISTKFFHGHTFGASGALSLDFLLNFINNPNYKVDIPYQLKNGLGNDFTLRPKNILINGAGFGGVVNSILVSSAD